MEEEQAMKYFDMMMRHPWVFAVATLPQYVVIGVVSRRLYGKSWLRSSLGQKSKSAFVGATLSSVAAQWVMKGMLLWDEKHPVAAE